MKIAFPSEINAFYLPANSLSRYLAAKREPYISDCKLIICALSFSFSFSSSCAFTSDIKLCLNSSRCLRTCSS